eukprot:COSAG06_NODE_2721_length_6387_cov_3.702449_3_plen_123_part_00
MQPYFVYKNPAQVIHGSGARFASDAAKWQRCVARSTSCSSRASAAGRMRWTTVLALYPPRVRTRNGPHHAAAAAAAAQPVDAGHAMCRRPALLQLPPPSPPSLLRTLLPAAAAAGRPLQSKR